MVYPGDSHVFLLALAPQSISSGPFITIVDAVTGGAVVTGTAMTLIDGTQMVYRYVWDTTGMNEGTYVAVVSYASDQATVNNQYLDNVRLGDSRVTGRLALDATVAKEATCAKDVNVMKFSDYTPPSLDPAVQYIKSKIQLLPNDPASASNLAPLAAAIADIRDFALGSWYVDNDAHTLTMLRLDGTLLHTFNLEKTATQSNRIR